MTKTFTPIGTTMYDIRVVAGKPVWTSQDLDYMLGLLDAAKAEYGPTTTIRSFQSSHGHTNRDGDYTEDMRMHYKLVVEGPVYSPEDRIAMQNDQIQAYFESQNSRTVHEETFPQLMSLIKTKAEK
jgi:hypothetical protein